MRTPPPYKKHSSSRKFLTSSIFLRLLLVIFITLSVATNAWGAEGIYKTALFGASYNSKKISSYTDSWSATNDGFTVNLTNANNNSNGWNYIKMGRKDYASTGTITTAAAIDKAVTKVTLTIDAITSSNVTSITLKSASTLDGTYTEVGTFTKSTGTQTITISSPKINLFFKIEVVCKSGSSNGLITISRVDYHADLTPAATYDVSWVVNGEEIDVTKDISEGSKVPSLPAEPEIDCSGKVFVGWSDQEVLDGENPAVLFRDVANSPTITKQTTFYAVFAESGGSSVTTWSKTDISAINDGDEVVVVMNNGKNYALYDANGTGSAPTATLINVSNNLIASPSEDIVWVIGKSGNDLTFYKDDTEKTWLYCTATNNGVRVGTNINKTFTIDTSSGYLKHTATSRYVGIYNSQDWRCYDNTTGNIKGQTLAFYKKTTTAGYQNYTTECSTPTEFTVSFNANGHGTAPTQQTVTSGGYAQEPNDDPSETGYNFQGWYNNSSCTGEPFDFENTPITDDITLYAKWTAIQTIITLNANGGSGNTTSVAATYDSSTLNPSSITNPTKTGHTFGGWYSGEGGTGSLVINSSGKLQANVSGFTGTNGVWKATTNKTLYAKWTPAVYTINYKDQGDVAFSGTHEGGYPTTHTYNTATTLKLASKNHYTFGGWYKESDCSGTPVTTLGATEYTDEITLYAKWTANTYTITFNAGNGECVTGSATTTNVGGVILPTATHICPDWTFAGWWTEEVSSTNTSPGTLFNAGDTYKPASDITLYAVYSQTETIQSDEDELSQTLKYDSWSYAGSTTDKGDYRMFHTGSYVESNGFDLSTLTKVVVYGGTFGGDKYNSLTIGDGTNIWKSVTVTGNSQTGKNSFTGGSALSGNGKLRITSNSGTASTNGVRISKIEIYTVSSITTTTYNSNPTCLVPVWEGATIDKTNLTVNCGERSSMDGAAKITFSKDKIFDFSNPITIEASEGFLVSTSRTPNENYQQSVSQSPLVGTEYPNTFNGKFVYVRAEAPAQSDTDLEGTITIKNSKGETLQTFSVAADVTCTQYTLTLVDRGVSTEQPTKYYAGETIDEAPADPEGVCTDPIHYVFDGWAEATVAEGSTTYTKVTFPYTVEGNTKFYAVYRYVEDGSADSGDYMKVTENLDDYSGDYLIVYETGNVAFDGGLDELDGTSNTIEVTIDNNTIESNATTDAAKFTIAKVDGGYSIQSTSGYYIGRSATSNGLSTNETYSANYDLNTITDCKTIKGKGGNILKYNKAADQKRFRYYQSGQETIALYRKAASYLYTTSPVCGPHLAITEGKEIYVTGGNAGGTRDLVIAQQKVSYKATRLNVGPTSQVPDVKVATNGITVGGVVTSDVKVTIDQTKEQQTDGTYTITGTITVQYQPSANNKQEDIQVQLAVDYNTDAKDNFIVHARSLPSEFVIVAKSGDKWYALNGDMNNGSSANPANGQVTLDNDANPTKATYAPCNTIYTFDGVPNTGDRTYVRFQGADGAWLWASSGTNTGIQNNVLKTTPEGSNKAYNWKLYTEDNITYRFGNSNSSRQLTLNGEKFGMYASGVQDIRILPYEAKCLYNYAPSNLKVSVLKGTYVILTWDAVAGATKYQYSTNGTTWTDAGAEPTVTINNLTGATEYIYYIRAYHEDTGVSQECIDYAEITFTTADCDDVPTDITYTADLNSITVSWTAAAPTATIKLFMDEEGAHMAGSYPGAESPYRISGGLDKNTTYYIQILADGTCASPIIPVKTEDVEVDIVEWYPQGIIVDINTDETVGVTLENEVSYGSGLGTEATELFFSKYYEASYNVKLVAIYNGTKNIIDLTDYIIKYGKTSWESNYITLKDFGATKGQIQPGEEIILYSYTENNADDKKILDCVHEAFPDGNWVRVTNNNNTGKGILAFGGDKTLALFKGTDIIDIIGAVNGSIPNNSKANNQPSWGDANGWICDEGLSLADDSKIGISTNRCLLVRNNTVTSGANAVASNTTDFVTLCSEWKGAHVLDSDVDNGIQESCENFAYVGTFDYSDYYTKYESMGEGTTFEENDRNPDGTVTIEIPDLYKHACSNIRVKLTNSNGDVLTDREYKVPIMITSTQGTDGQAFIDLRQNLATKEVDGEGNVIDTHPLSLEEVREICKTCDVVVRDNATLTKIADDAANDHPQVRNVYVYENSSLIVPNGTNYTINNLSLRRNQDAVASVSTHPDALKLLESAAAPISLDFRLSAENWHWFTLPYDCNINEVTWADGTPAQYNTDWYLMTYDGEKRAATQAGGCWKTYTGTTIKAGEGFIIAINGNVNNPAHTYELRFPMSKEVLAAEGTDKTVAVRAWGVETNIRPNHKGWNLVGNPYLAYYQRNNITNFEGLRLGQLTGPDLQTGYWEQTGDVPYVVVPVGAGWIAYEQVLASETDLLPFTAYFVQVGNDGKHDSSNELSISFDHTKLQLSATPMPASIIQRATSETEVTEPVIVGVSLTNSLGESDKTSLVIDNQFTDEYEMNADFFKWFGDYYKYYTKPVVYSLGADNGKRAFNALSEDLATQPVSLGMYAAQAGNYTFTLDRRSDLSKVQEVWLYDATQDQYTNLMQDSYTFNTAKTESAGRFFLSVKMAPKVSTDINNVTDGTIWATTQDHTIFVNGLLSNAQLWIYDATGKLLHTDQTQFYQHTYQVPVSGTYFVRVQNTMQTQTIKVVVE